LKRFLLAAAFGATALLVGGGLSGANPNHDNFSAAQVLAALPYQNSTSTMAATTEAGEPSDCGGITATVWYEYTPGSDQIIVVDTFGSDYDTVLAAYSGTSLLDLDFIACNDDFQGLTSALFLGLSAGTTYYIQAGGFFGAAGDLHMNADLVASPQVEPTTITIDIKPDGEPNSINLGNNGVIPVAILAVDGFDPATVDQSSVVFAGASRAHGDDNGLKDVDGDSDLDLVMHFRTQETNIQPSDTEACLVGDSSSVGPFQGCDSVRIVPANQDLDLDAFGDANEASLGTPQFFYCSKSDVYLAWPPDLDGDGVVSGSDVFTIFPKWLKTVADDDFEPRQDLNVDEAISSGDVFKLFPVWLQSCD